MNHIETDSYADWILKCLGVYDNGDYLDKMEKDFEVTLFPEESETLSDIQCVIEQHPDNPMLGNIIAIQIFNEVVSKAVNELGANENDFEIDLCAATMPDISCKGKIVKNWYDIQKNYNV